MKFRAIKTVFLGNANVGKTSITYRLIKNKYENDFGNTIGASFMTLTINNIKYDIWDTSGQERFESLTSSYYRNAQICLLVFDVTDEDSIDKIINYLQKIHINYSKPEGVIILGNKIDLINHDEKTMIDNILHDKIKSYENIFNIDIIYISALTGENINALKLSMSDIATKIIEKLNEEHYNNEIYNDKNIIFVNQNDNLTEKISEKLISCDC